VKPQVVGVQIEVDGVVMMQIAQTLVLILKTMALEVLTPLM
jgi:hypothetical protein